ncbi:MAG: CRISPR-associated RAMP protein, Csx10 family [Phormidium sp. OSCR]|nr:MAG: CRISPR-associated RAMP protein, Csx10 family [Phormidium sp. OSCR]
MKQIQLTITAKSALAIGRKKPGSVSEAADFIAGSVIRGAIAGHLLRAHPNNSQPQPGDDFSRLFVEDKAAIFQNAYPSLTADSAVDLLPVTAVSAKAKPGFKPKGYGVFDTLIDRFCAEACGQLYDPNCPQAAEKGEGRVEPFSGFYNKTRQGYQTLSVPKRLLTRVGINRRRATAEEQILYSLEVLDDYREDGEPVVYRGGILLEEDSLADALSQFINQNRQRFRLGGSASRGLGQVEIQATAVPWQSNLKPRLKQFNQLLQQRWQLWTSLYPGRSRSVREPRSLPQRNYFTLNLQSDAILRQNWRRTTVITAEDLKQLTGVSDDSLTLHNAYSSFDTVSGWNSAWGFMKDVELTTTKGGLYLFGTNHLDAWSEALSQLEYKGIGDRTLEGFGQVKVCHEFHQVFRENAL